MKKILAAFLAHLMISTSAFAGDLPSWTKREHVRQGQTLFVVGESPWTPTKQMASRLAFSDGANKVSMSVQSSVEVDYAEVMQDGELVTMTENSSLKTNNSLSNLLIQKSFYEKNEDGRYRAFVLLKYQINSADRNNSIVDTTLSNFVVASARTAEETEKAIAEAEAAAEEARILAESASEDLEHAQSSRSKATSTVNSAQSTYVQSEERLRVAEKELVKAEEKLQKVSSQETELTGQNQFMEKYMPYLIGGVLISLAICCAPTLFYF